jgi:anti-anti-sigma factor
VLELHGEIDIAAAVEIIPHLDAATSGPGARIVIDLRHVEFFDCSGLRLLYRARQRVLDRDGELRLVCTHPLTLRVLKVTGLARLLPPASSLEAALEQPEAATGTL